MSRHPVAILVLTIAGVLSLNAVAYLKFRTFDPLPLQYYVEYKNTDRWAKIDGSKFHLSNLHFNIDAYLVRPNVTLTRSFPYVYASHLDPAQYPGAKIDNVEDTLGLPYAMPDLCFLAGVGFLIALIRATRDRLKIIVPWLAVLPVAIVTFAGIGQSHRYTADLCPFLIWTAAIGLIAIEHEAGYWKWVFRTVVVALTTVAVAVNLALTLNLQGNEIGGIPLQARANYQTLKDRVDTLFGVKDNWYLVGPPRARGAPVRADAPLSQWYRLAVFRTAARCEMERVASIKSIDDKVAALTHPGSGDERGALLAVRSHLHCVRADDPQLLRH
jgi:hypothetical protein